MKRDDSGRLVRRGRVLRGLGVLFLSLCSIGVRPQAAPASGKQVLKVFVVDSKVLANVQVKIVDFKAGADLCVFPVDSKALADLTIFVNAYADRTAYASKSQVICQ